MVLVRDVLVDEGEGFSLELPRRGQRLLEGNTSASVYWAMWSSMVRAKERVGETVPVVVAPASVAEQVAREPCPLLVARHAVVRLELAVIVLVVPASWRHLCTPAAVA